MKTLTLSLATLLLGAAPALAEELILSSWLPPRHPIVVNAIEPWAEEVAEVTEGRVTVRIMARPLGTPPAHFDMARDGVADITYGLHSFTEDDRFERAKLGQFSFLGDDAVTNSQAYWDIYTGQLDASAEHAGTRLLGLFMHGPGLLHNNQRKIETPADMAGMKIRVPGGYAGDLVAALGAAPLFMSSPEVYERLSRGVIDGVAFTYEAMTAFNLTDHIKYSMTVPGGIYNTTWFLVMNEGKWEGLSEADRAAIDAISGPAFAERVGKAWNDADIAAKEEVGDKVEFHEASPEVVTALREAASALEAQWAEGLGEYDGLAALAEFRKRTGVGIE
ncbi:ABC transporter substrate-binding protein [Frigidibacter albus]|uniref:ABC transporter substrate-binding protein n=1 Tax=Frigidibacter albus TaxID=1465486 RepID=A0A6L8VB44_9RHOB|nr:TRAP transporter substrate-binding protein [Frigidibacter albus]MZQ87484.1 ABC transporter substrate-binding protein [Frigidibacter albus]NBE29390.1 ABC transporter substrate-binding protein [Frigidibacter albus]GGH45223.1 ABC transporter substrate-binding protein [Frigidibacter albus]